MDRAIYRPRIRHKVDLVQRVIDLVIVASDCVILLFFCHPNIQFACIHFMLIFILILEQHGAISVETSRCRNETSKPFPNKNVLSGFLVS